jgi:hypothetical protein
MHNEARHCAQFEASFNEHRSQVGGKPMGRGQAKSRKVNGQNDGSISRIKNESLILHLPVESREE